MLKILTSRRCTRTCTRTPWNYVRPTSNITSTKEYKVYRLVFNLKKSASKSLSDAFSPVYSDLSIMTTWPSSYFNTNQPSLFLEDSVELRIEFIRNILFPSNLQDQLIQWNEFFFRNFLRIDIGTNPDFSIIPNFPELVDENGNFDVETLMGFSKPKMNFLEAMDSIIKRNNKRHKNKPLTYEILKKVEQHQLYQNGFIAKLNPLSGPQRDHLPEEAITQALAESIQAEIDPKLYRRGLAVIKKIREELVGTCVQHERNYGKTVFVHYIDYLRRPDSLFHYMKNFPTEHKNKTFLHLSKEENITKKEQPLFIPLSDQSQTNRLNLTKKVKTITREIVKIIFDKPEANLFLERPEVLSRMNQNFIKKRIYMHIPECYGILPKMTPEAAFFGNFLFGWYHDILFENKSIGLEERVGYTFQSRKLLKEVFIHISALSHTHNNKLSTLGLCVGSLLLKQVALTKNLEEKPFDCSQISFYQLRKGIATVTGRVKLLDATIKHSRFVFEDVHERDMVFRLWGAIFRDGGWDGFLKYFFANVMNKKVPDKEKLDNIVNITSIPYNRRPLLSETEALAQLSHAEEILDFKFQDYSKLVKIVQMPYGHVYERLEFLGDAVMAVVTIDVSDQVNKSFSTHLYEEMQKWNTNDAMMDYTKKLFPKFSSLIKKNKTMADTFEALLGALFLVEGYERARVFVLKNLLLLRE